MARFTQFAVPLAFAGLLLTGLGQPAHAQEGGKMLEKEGKTNNKQLRENHRMMRDGKVKHGESMSREPKIVREEDRMKHRKAATEPRH